MIINMVYTIDSIESRFEWKIGALQKGLADPVKYKDQAYQAHDEEEMRVYLEEEAVENGFYGDENRFEEEEDAEAAYSLKNQRDLRNFQKHDLL